MTQPAAFELLLVDDDEADLMLIEEALVLDGTERTVTRALDGNAALGRLRDPAARRPDLIVLDLNMPGMSGHELLAIIKGDQDLKTIPVIVLSSSRAPDDIAGAYDHHANAYVTKPVNLDDFLRVVSAVDAFFLETALLASRRAGL